MNWQLVAELTVVGLLGFVVGSKKSEIASKLHEVKECLLSLFANDVVTRSPSVRFNQTLEEFNKMTHRDDCQDQNTTLEEFNKLWEGSDEEIDALTLEEFNRIAEEAEEEFFDQTLDDFNRSTLMSRTSSQFAMNTLDEFNYRVKAGKRRSSTR